MEIIFYLFLFIFGVILAVFLLTVFFGAPYVPTHKKELIKLFEKLKLSKNDILADIGSGDGVVLKTASNFSAESIGFEINPFLVLISKIRLRNSKNTQIYFRNFWHVFPIEKMLKLAQIQANHQKTDLLFISYGFEIKNLKPFKIYGAHFVYKINPKK